MVLRLGADDDCRSAAFHLRVSQTRILEGVRGAFKDQSSVWTDVWSFSLRNAKALWLPSHAAVGEPSAVEVAVAVTQRIQL